MRLPRTLLQISPSSPLTLQLKRQPQKSATIHHLKTRNLSTSRTLSAQNRIYTSVRTPSELSTLILLSSSSHQPLLTLWTASYSRNSPAIAPLLTQLISIDKVGQNIPVTTLPSPGTPTGVGFAEIEADVPDMMAEDIMGRYSVYRVPMLMAFSRGEAQVGTRVSEEEKLMDEVFLRGWIEQEAARGGGGGAGGGGFGGLFGWLRGGGG